ncbi:MAG: Cna B-type domain-containing protein [Clostridiales bacterium]|nr:Cna B-type domain-containing protein [Clostridiales bacterium]
MKSLNPSIKSKIFRRVTIFVALLLCVCVFSNPVSLAAGSKNLVADYDSDTDTWKWNGGYRPHTEWYNATTSDILRHQIIYVYACEGEKLLIGSSVVAGVEDVDIAYTKADGITTGSLDVSPAGDTALGYISTYSMETKGPDYTDLGNAGGYKPIEVNVDQTGVWKFEFHSSNNTIDNPSAVKGNTAWNTAQKATVAAWDITVVKSVGGINQEITGRVFVTFLSLNIGKNMESGNVLNSTIYVLTADGYVYETDFNGLDPYGFIFFANNRGLIDSRYDTSLYKSAWATDDMTMVNLQARSADGATVIPTQFHLPVHKDTELDTTFKIFFEPPSDDLPESIKPTPYAPGQVTDFRFVGDTTGHGYVSYGGYFYFNVVRASSFQVKIDLTQYTYEEGGETVNGGIVYLANACTDGLNRIYWDGNDARGVPVKAGTYNDESGTGTKIVVSIETKAGEYHFPMLDVENNYSGIKIKLINNPIDSNGSAIELTDAQRSMVYYDNSGLPAGGTKALEGEDSSAGSSVFTGRAGNNAAIDIWTYFKDSGGGSLARLNEFVLEDVPSDNNTGTITGFVFYDANRDAKFKMSDDDYELSHVTVGLYDSNDPAALPLSVVQTDAIGWYVFEGVDYGSYYIRVSNPNDSSDMICTTSNQVQQVTLNDVMLTADMVGFFYNVLDKPIVVQKVWTVSALYDTVRPASVEITATGRRSDNSIAYTKTVTVAATDGWRYSFSGLPKFDSGGDALTYTITEEDFNIYGVCVADLYFSTVGTAVETITETQYTVTNSPKARIMLIKSDSADASKHLQGAVFELWKKGSPNSLIGEYTTGANGQIIATGLADGTYYFTEKQAPDRYALNTAPTPDIVIDNSNKTTSYSELTVFNDRLSCDFTLTKTLTAVSDEDERFVFELTGPDGISYCVLTVPAGSTTASQSFANMPAGLYTLRELDNNWRYSVVAGDTRASDGTNTFAFAGGALAMRMDSASENYSFVFTNSRTNEYWVGGSAHVTNKMQSIV